MLDGKILAAVLATLTAVAVSTSGANLENQELQTNPSEMSVDIQGLAKNPVKKAVELFTTTPKPTSSVKANLQAENLWTESISAKKAEIKINNLTAVNYAGTRINSDKSITAYRFSGTVESGNTSTAVSGTSSGVLTSGVNISASSRFQAETSTSKIEIKGIEETSIAVSEVSGSIESSNYSTEFDSSRTLSIDSFSGDITVYPDNKTVVLNGKVNRLSAGPFQFGN